ncbi:MAG: potassium/proton antiporter [Eubacteriales bacterium]
MAVYLLLASIVIFACVLLNKISMKLGIPVLLAFILLGMFFGSDGVVKIPFENYSFAERICSVGLIFIMFYGGFGTNWRAARPVAARAILLSSLGVVLTSAAVGVFCRYVLGTGLAESFLIGSVIGSTDAASVFSILRSRRLNLRCGTASLLELESGSNDPFSYMLTAVFISLINGTARGAGIAYMLFAQLVYGIAGGAVIALAARLILKKIKFSQQGMNAVFMVGVAVLAYALPSAVGGNGYLSAYIVGIVLGNSDIADKKSLVNFFDGVNNLTQMLIFFLLGLLSAPSRLPNVMLPALAIALFLTFVARPLAVMALLTPFGCKIKQQLVVAWAGLRGAASIVFAIQALLGAKTENDIFHIVFCIVLFSILLQGSLIPFVSRRLGMIDDSDDVMKTFSDYSEEAPVEFIQFTVPRDHMWAGMAVRDIVLPPDTILVLLIRGQSLDVPNGSSVLGEGDTLILSARSPGRIEGIRLSEIKVEGSSPLDGAAVADFDGADGALIIMIRRGEQVIIPNGKTMLCEGDTLVINHPS